MSEEGRPVEDALESRPQRALLAGGDVPLRQPGRADAEARDAHERLLHVLGLAAYIFSNVLLTFGYFVFANFERPLSAVSTPKFALKLTVSSKYSFESP